MSSLLQWSVWALSLSSLVQATPLSTNPYDAPNRPPPFTVAPVLQSFHPHGTINNSYIVIFKPDLPQALRENHLNFLQSAQLSNPLNAEFAGISQVYDGHVTGYAGHFSEATLKHIQAMPEVDFIERDQIVRTMDIETQKSAPWGLARVSHREKLSFGTFNKYVYDTNGGAGVDVYVIDTGINIEHVELEGRAQWGKTMPLNDVDEDGNGHGSHCAGTIASRKYGVAKAANVIAVKVLGSNGSGSMSDVVGGVVWAAGEAKRKADAAKAEIKATGRSAHRGSVANMSLGGGKSRALDDAVNRAVDSGLHFAVAAGNDNRDACSYSPAAAEKAVTVGASTLSDERAYFSNHGPCVDVFGPGLNILSIFKGGKTATAMLSGTSMASPHVAGLLAYLLSLDDTQYRKVLSDKFTAQSVDSGRVLTATSIYSTIHAALPSWASAFLPPPVLVQSIVAPIPAYPPSPAQLKDAVLLLSTSGVLTDLPDKTPNLLIFNNVTTS